MSFSRILALKKEKNEKIETRYIRHLVVGSDLFSIMTYEKLVSQFGENEVGLLLDKELSQEDLFPMGPSFLRGDANLEAFKNRFPDVELNEYKQPSLFFKDQKFRKFNGRSKPEKLLWSEEFFTSERVEINYKTFFPKAFTEGFLDNLNKKRLGMVLSGLVKTEPTDLVDPVHYKLSCANGVELTCETLYWGETPQAYLDYYQDKKHLSDELIRFCEMTKSPAVLYIDLVFEDKVTDELGTLFIPKSYTHDWGHFIAEFSEINTENKTQMGRFMCFIDKDQTSEEDISKKIRLLKRHLEKIFEKKSKIFSREFIKLSTTSPCLNIDDSMFNNIKSEIVNMKMISFNAPLSDRVAPVLSFEDSGFPLAYFSRGALSLNEDFVSLT